MKRFASIAAVLILASACEPVPPAPVAPRSAAPLRPRKLVKTKKAREAPPAPEPEDFRPTLRGGPRWDGDHERPRVTIKNLTTGTTP